VTRSSAGIPLIKRPIDQPVEEHRGGARANHARENKEQYSQREPAMRGDDECAERKWQREDRVRKTNQPQKTTQRSARHAGRFNLSSFQLQASSKISIQQLLQALARSGQDRRAMREKHPLSFAGEKFSQ